METKQKLSLKNSKIQRCKGPVEDPCKNSELEASVSVSLLCEPCLVDLTGLVLLVSSISSDYWKLVLFFGRGNEGERIWVEVGCREVGSSLFSIKKNSGMQSVREHGFS